MGHVADADVYTRGPNAAERMVMEARQIVIWSSTQDDNEENWLGTQHKGREDTTFVTWDTTNELLRNTNIWMQIA